MPTESSDKDWRASVELRFAALSQKVDANTVLTADINTKLTTLAAQVGPIYDALSSMRRGIITIGKVGYFFDRATRIAIYCLAIFLFVKIFFSTGSVEEALVAFWRAVAK